MLNMEIFIGCQLLQRVQVFLAKDKRNSLQNYLTTDNLIGYVRQDFDMEDFNSQTEK
jgi:hypothetical protein